MMISVIIVGLVPYYARDLYAKVVAARANPVQITCDIEKTTKALVEELQKFSKEVEGSELADVAAVSAVSAAILVTCWTAVGFRVRKGAMSYPLKVISKNAGVNGSIVTEKDDYGRIAILPFYLYVMRTVSLTQARNYMSELDEDSDGFLQLHEMEPYLRGLIDMPATFVQMYCRIAARKFFFFGDPHKRGKACIKKVLLSNFLQELLKLHQESEEEISSCSTPVHDKHLQILVHSGGVMFICLHLTTAAWGQATFQGGRNVTSRPAWSGLHSLGHGPGGNWVIKKELQRAGNHRNRGASKIIPGLANSRLPPDAALLPQTSVLPIPHLLLLLPSLDCSSSF